jgi:hypothetical protein
VVGLLRIEPSAIVFNRASNIAVVISESAKQDFFENTLWGADQWRTKSVDSRTKNDLHPEVVKADLLED